MRRHLLDLLKANPSWEPVSDDLAYLFTSWFNRGFLTLMRIDWRTSALVLEKLIEYEAVHAIKGFGSELHTLLLVEIDKGRRAAAAKARV